MGKCASTGKVRYADCDSAQAAQARLPYRVDPYPCPECAGWHLGGHHRRHKGDALAQYKRTSCEQTPR